MLQQSVICGHMRQGKVFLTVPLSALSVSMILRPLLYCSRIAPECNDHQFLPKHASAKHASVYVDTDSVQILCLQTKPKHTLSYTFPLGQTSVSLRNVGNVRALTSPLNLKNEEGMCCLSDTFGSHGFMLIGCLCLTVKIHLDKLSK